LVWPHDALAHRLCVQGPRQTGRITYEELADPKWKGKICIRSGQHVYNTSLLATLIAHKGEAFAEEWLKGLKANLAHKPAGGDREQARDIYSGKCDLAVGNTYYMALMATNEKNPEQKRWGAAIKPLFPNANDRGSHVNISGMALAKHAPNKANALKLMDYLASDAAQKIYATANNEYPVNPRWNRPQLCAAGQAEARCLATGKHCQVSQEGIGAGRQGQLRRWSELLKGARQAHSRPRNGSTDPPSLGAAPGLAPGSAAEVWLAGPAA
jgi:ABC-type thiamine transport system substrate-binding protein